MPDWKCFRRSCGEVGFFFHIFPAGCHPASVKLPCALAGFNTQKIKPGIQSPSLIFLASAAWLNLHTISEFLQQLVGIIAPNHDCVYTSILLSPACHHKAVDPLIVSLFDNHIHQIKLVFVPEPLEQSWSVCQCDSIQLRATGPDGMWRVQVTFSETDAAGRLRVPCHYAVRLA